MPTGDLVSTVQAAAQSAADQNIIVPAYEVEVKGDKDHIDKPSGQVGCSMPYVRMLSFRFSWGLVTIGF